MDAPFPYRTLSTHQLGRYEIELGELACEDGPSPYSFIRMRPFASCVAFVDGKLALVRQYRYSVDDWRLEVCAGGIDDGEDPRDAAVRELREETGLVAEQVWSLGVQHPSVGSTDEECHLFAMRCSSERVPCEFDRGEATELVLFTREEAEELLDADLASYMPLFTAWVKLTRMGLIDELLPR